MTDVHAAAPRHGGTTVRFLGHSTFELDLGVATVLTDPVLRHRVLFLRRTASRPAPPPRPPTVVLVSHLHHDHLDLPSLAGWALQSVLIVPRGSQRLFRRHGFSHAVPPVSVLGAWRNAYGQREIDELFTAHGNGF